MPAARGGDDLDDDFIVDHDLVADTSDVEADFVQLEDEDLYVAGEADAEEDTQNAGEKKRKRKLKEKERKAKKRKLQHTVEEEPQRSISCQTPSILANHLAGAQKKALPKLTELELEELRIDEGWIMDTTSFTAERTLNSICSFIGEALPTLKTRLAQKPKNKGAPTLILVAGAALRVADLTRVMKSLKGEKGGDIAKLFARHFKLEEHVEYLKRTLVGAAVGTPGRLGKLRESGALTLSALTHIIIDTSYQDVKKRSILDIPETREELFKHILSNQAILDGMRAGRVKLALF